MGRKQVIGTCHICGTHGKLSFEHVPPRSAFNDTKIKRYGFQQIFEMEPGEIPSIGGKIEQRGAGDYTLCSQPELYSVEDGYLRCGGLWGLRMDNNHEKYVVVYLGDLGRDLPSGEWAYWKSFNVTPDGTISDVNWKRNFLAQFTDPEKADLVFKLQFNIFQKNWQKKFGWPIFKPLSEDDEHNFKVLRVPITNEQHEFDQQVLALAKVLIDSLNEKQMEHHISEKLPKEVKGISKLAKFLEAHGLMDFESHIKFLRSLWDLRIGAGHRKGDVYQRGAAYFKLEERPLAQVFEEILQQATTFLRYLDKKFLSTEKFPEQHDG